MVPDMITGQRRPWSANSVSSAKIAALAFRVSKIVSTRSRSAPPSTRPLACSRYAATSSSYETFRAPGSLTSGEIDAVRFVGPREPATQRGRSSVRDLVAGLACDPGSGEVDLVGEVLHAVVGLGDRRGREGVGLHDVRARVEVLTVDGVDHVGLGEVEQVAVPLDVPVPVGESLAPELGLPRRKALDEGAHGAVDHQDALAQGPGQRLRGIRAWRRVGHGHSSHGGITQA